ncbi:BTAD domain-containing putative transcriptional regulator [Streptacidiphilus sp. EB129]|uniref:AfsR/SARP family transcriptional regulator n=1 Tax=Streptacidiphilus sp. EB129 TaxID=3156262 RepID=UPI0035119C9F
MSGSKVHTVLATMLLAEGRVVSDTRLSSMLWGWDPPATASAQIYTYMSRLRRYLGLEVEIVRRPPGYVLNAPGSRIDVEEFERLDRLGREALRERRYPEAQSLLREALRLWQGPALANVTEFMQETELPRLEEARMLTLESRIEADLALGLHEPVTAELTRLVAEFPMRERLRAQLMTALYRCGRQADALNTFHQGRALLAEQLGVDPGEALGATYQAVLVGDVGRPEAELTRRAPVRGVPSMLPPAEDHFIGRGRELAELTRRLTERTAEGGGPRRLLITGMAGVGKTTLAVRAAGDSAASFPDGVLFAELCHPDGTAKDTASVLRQLLRGLGDPAPEHEGAQQEELVRRYRGRTAGRQLLVVLDNAVGDLQLAPLLPGGADAVVLITSRPRLARVSGADTLALYPLDEEEALELLASSIGPDRLEQDRDATDDLVAYCGGLPLALSIVAAKLASRPHWPLGRLAARLADPSRRLGELSFGDVNLRRALLPSVRRLGPEPLEALARLSPAGTGTFPAAAAAEWFGVSEDEAEESLEELVDAALLDLSALDPQGRPLYRCHELVLLLSSWLGAADLAGVADTAAAAG